ncbi:hypothetical protein [Paenibacillus sp. FSL L8-0708]|uniref:hypothetical protein n=1 Tax=Paenibacillus sp. FSL L8-0708 TaxID=2975311 RepID=UPI0030FA5BF9
MSNNDNNDVVILDLDRPRELRYGHKALKKLVAITGKNIEEIDTENFDLAEIEKYIYCGLLSDATANGEVITLEQMEDLLDQAPSFSHIVEQMTKAFNVSFGALAETAEGNQQASGETVVYGTGKTV